jgi:hypothetical protein
MDTNKPTLTDSSIESLVESLPKPGTTMMVSRPDSRFPAPRVLSGTTEGIEPLRNTSTMQKRRARIVRTVFSSDGTHLAFPTDALAREYDDARRALDLEFYRRIRAQYGIYAGNQERFVESLSELNPWDPREMETRLASDDAQRAAAAARRESAENQSF